MPDEPRDPSLSDLLQRHLPELRAFVRFRAGALVREHESASDLVQSVCLELLRERERFELRSEAALRQWLYQAAERKIVDRVRYWEAEKRDPAREVHGEREADAEQLLAAYATVCTPSRVAIAREEVLRIEAAMDALPADYREVILAARFLWLSHAEIATRMDKSEGAVRVLLSRALARLSQSLAGAS